MIVVPVMLYGEDGMNFKTLAAAAVMALGGLSAPSFAAVILSGGGSPISVDATNPPGQDFLPELLGVTGGAGNSTLYSGDTTTPLSLIASGGDEIRLIFSLVAAESDFDNELLFNGSSVISENEFFDSVDFATGVLNGETFSVDVAFGTDIASLLTFRVSGGPATFDADTDHEFGIFADATQIGGLTTFYLGLDDNGNNEDDNHDDIIIRVEASIVPLPATGLLLLGGIGGLAFMRRRKQS